MVSVGKLKHNNPFDQLLDDQNFLLVRAALHNLERVFLIGHAKKKMFKSKILTKASE